MAQHVCPWWVGYILASPLRKLVQNPIKILKSYVKPGMTVLDVGPGMGFFSFDAARLAGDGGRVICVDLQEKMIESLRRRAARKNLAERINGRVCNESSLMLDDLTGQVDLALAINVAHEVPDLPRFMAEIHRALKPDGRLFMIEPRGHISVDDFANTVDVTRQCDFSLVERPEVRRSRAAVFVKG
ncbi:MAG: class I SAM-dependent methyltransferase [candidate division Zixibacteria bacterium]|nr:class I SAM-dependent methyltransferase [candidate division Zixibacteria bacterium]